MNLLKNLDYLLRINNLTRAQLSRELNIAPSTINTWFSKGCENISLRFLIKISEYFGISIDDLVHHDLESDKNEKDLRLAQSIYRMIRVIKDGEGYAAHSHRLRQRGIRRKAGSGGKSRIGTRKEDSSGRKGQRYAYRRHIRQKDQVRSRYGQRPCYPVGGSARDGGAPC